MTKKMLVASIILAMIVVVGSGTYYLLNRKPKISVEEKPLEIIQQYKTYVSKYGFSVSYPADWQIEEIWNTYNIPKEKKGMLPFNIYDPTNQNIDINFINRSYDMRESPIEISKKLAYLAKNEIMKEIYEEEIINMDGNVLYMVSGIKKGDLENTNSYYIFFCIPKTNTIEIVTFGNQDKRGIMELIRKIKIQMD